MVSQVLSVLPIAQCVTSAKSATPIPSKMGEEPLQQCAIFCSDNCDTPAGSIGLWMDSAIQTVLFDMFRTRLSQVFVNEH